MPTFPPSLTEVWATVYFQILIGVFIFALGIPAIEFQLVVEEDVRHVVVRRQTGMWIWKIIVWILFVGALSFVWFIHPISEGRKVVEGNPARVPAAYPSASPSPAIDVVGQVSPQPSAGSSVETSGALDDQRTQGVIAAALITLTFLLAITYGLRLPQKYKRSTVIDNFQKQMTEHFEKHGSLDPDALDDLVYLGEHGRAGDEKELVILAFKAVVAKVTTSERYTGRELKELLESLILILRNGTRPGSDRNYFLAAKLLKETWHEVHHLGVAIISNNDAQLAASLLRQLGIEAVKTMSEETALAYVGFAGDCADQRTVYALGIEAFCTRRFLIASGALSKLESLAIPTRNSMLAPNDATSALLGLLAYFVDYGEATRERARTFLARSRKRFSPSLDTCIKTALFYHYYNSNFDAVDRLIKMRQTQEQI